MGVMTLYSTKKSVNIVKRYKTEIGIKGETCATCQTALLNCPKVGRTDMLAGRIFQWMTDLEKM